MSARILVFARAPIPGRTKTRLIPALGAEGAAALHARLIEHALAEAGRARSAGVELWCADDPGHPFYRDCEARFGVTRHGQSGADLGERMEAALVDALGRADHAILIGSDSPDLRCRDLDTALLRLERGIPVVLGPASDGGYLLIGLRRPMPALFRDITWGSDQVLEQTRASLRSLDTDWVELEARHDIDRPEDLQRLPPEWR